MIYGVIDEKIESGYTQMGKVFDAINNKQIDYNWLITDIDSVPEKIHECCNGKNYCWLTGVELTRIVSTDSSQWIWAVLSGFEKSVNLSEILNHSQPYADGYKGFWSNPLSIQHPLASIELVAWDGCCTLLISNNYTLIENFKNIFSLSEDLLKYNTTIIEQLNYGIYRSDSMEYEKWLEYNQ